MSYILRFCDLGAAKLSSLRSRDDRVFTGCCIKKVRKYLERFKEHQKPKLFLLPFLLEFLSGLEEFRWVPKLEFYTS